MKIKLILFFSFFLSGLSHTNAFSEILPDSAKYKWIKGEKFLLHQVQPKETWNGISQKYGLPVSALMNANLGVIDLRIGQILNVPAANIPVSNIKKTESALPAANESKYQTAILYTVRAGETLFSISKKFGSTVEEVKKWNNLPDNIVNKGQKLIVSYVPPEPEAEIKPENKTKAGPDILVSHPKENDSAKIAESRKAAADEYKPEETVIVKKDTRSEKITEPEKSTDTAPASSHQTQAENAKKNPGTDENPTRTMIPVGKGVSGKTLMQVSESGVCSWINDADVNQNKFYGLHRSAAIGTIVKVTNKMNDKYVFVKIVGVLPDTGENQKSIIKISQAAVSKIGALDAHFQVELSYGVMQ
jgi:LysM repeat protein/rare lipoprotein A (peptidoglycan hydrolase)